MASKKGQRLSKGKKPSPKALLKRTAVDLSSSENEASEVDQQAILVQSTKLEEAQGLSPGRSNLGMEGSGAQKGRKTRQASKKRFQTETFSQRFFLQLDYKGKSANPAEQPWVH